MRGEGAGRAPGVDEVSHPRGRRPEPFRVVHLLLPQARLEGLEALECLQERCIDLHGDT